MRRTLPLLVPVVLILTLAAALRLRGLGRDSLWADEMSTVMMARLPLPELIRDSIAYENIPPLHHVILHFWIKVFGDGEFSVRVPSVLAGVAGVFVTYVLVRRLLGTRAALAAMLLMAVLPVQVVYSQECRSYSLSVLLGLVATDVFVRLLRRPTQRLHVAYAVVVALSLYAHLYGLFTVLAHHVVYLIELRRRGGRLPLRPRAWVVDNLAAAALFGPWLPVVFRWTRNVSANFWNKSVTLDAVAHTYWIFSGSTAAFLLMLALVVAGVAHLSRRAPAVDPVDPVGPPRRRRRGLVVMLALLVCPVLVPVVVSVLGRPMYAPRYAIIASVAMCALAGVGAAALPRAAGVAMLAAVVALAPFGTAADIPRGNWREAGAFLARNMRPGDMAVVSASASKRLFRYYVRRNDVDLRPVDTGSLPVSLPLDGRRVWLVVHDSWYPVNSFVKRANVRIERRLLTSDVLVAELTDEPWPDGTPAGPAR